MSRPSTAQTSRNPSIPRQSAWSKGPPLSSSTPSRSQSPAPATPIAQTHSRRPSALSGVPIKDGVSVTRNNVGAAKQGSAVTFGSIDDVSAPISSSPAAAPSIKTEGVKSFGTIEAETHVNGKPTLSSRPSVAVPPSTTSSSTSSPAVSVATPTTTAAKLAKTDIAKLFQNPSSAPSPQPSSDTSSPSLRSSGLPPSSSQTTSSQPPQSSAPSQPSQLGSHSFTPYRHPPSGAGSGAPRSPAFSARQVASSSGPRSQGGPNGAPSQMNAAGMSSPRLAPMPHNGQPSGMPPPPQMQPPMAQQMPVTWTPYYYPGMQDSHYYQPAWYPPSHHPPPGGPHGPPHAGMPISPRNPPMPLQGSGTPTLSHATANPVHPPHPPPPMAHPSTSMGSISSPPPTPSTTSSRLNANSIAFVPPRSKVTLKKADGTEVNLENLKPSSSPANNASTNGQGPTYRQGSPGTLNPNRRSVRIETPEQRSQRLAEERVKAEADEKVKKEKEAEERKQKEQEERKRREEEEKRRKEEEEEKRRKEEEEEKERIRKEEEEKERIRKQEEEKERIRKEEEEKERLRKEAEEEERIRREEEEKERLRKEAEEKERIRRKEEERERIRKEEEERQRKEEEERKRKEEEEKERQRQEEEEKERQRQEEERAARAKEAEEAAAKAKQARGDDAVDASEEGEVSTPKEAKEASKERVRESLRINTSESLKKRPGPLNLSNAGPVSASLPSALATARAIDDLSRVQYPEGIASPNPELNTNAKDGKFRYDRDFLLQFMAICKEKPDMLPPLDAIGLEPIDQASLVMTRSSSGRHRQPSGTSAPSRSASIGLGFSAPSNFAKSTGLNPFAGGGMGNFSTGGSKLGTSEERFLRSSSGPVGMNFGRPVPMQRTPSQGGAGGLPGRTRSQRGNKTRDGSKAAAQQAANVHAAQPANFEPVAPLKVSENRWDRKALQADADSPEMVDRKVRGLLNKLTMERFDSISDQIIEWANKSEKEKDGRTLIQVIRLVFEKATDEATWSEMYARLCRKMMEQISNKVQDDGIKNPDGKPIAGGQLFRKYLLNRCQEDFERGWVAKEATAAAAASKAMEDEAVKKANEKNKEGGDGEVALYSDEYYAAQKAKRQGLGLIKFIGELFKLQMLTERIMHECVKKLLGNVNNPEEEEIESLCKLLTTVGQLLDTPKAHAHMDVYFQRMRELTKSPNVSPRMQFMLQDVIELRERKWVARNAIAAPTTIAQIHEAAAKEKAAHDKEYSQRQISMSRGGSRRGGDRSEQPQVNPEGWAVAGNAARPPSKAVDLSNFGKISKAPPTMFGPGSVFAGKKTDKRESLSRTSSSSNMFSMLQNAESGADKTPEAQPQRKRLTLLPRTKPLEPETQQQQDSSEDEEASTPAAPAEMGEEGADKKIKEDSKEFFGVRNLDEAEVYFTALPAQYHHKLVDKLVSTAVESKEADAQLVSDLFARAVSKNLCSPAAFEEGFTPVAEIIDDIAIDAPKAFALFVTMIRGAGFDEERRSRLASKSMDSDKLLGLLS